MEETRRDFQLRCRGLYERLETLHGEMRFYADAISFLAWMGAPGHPVAFADVHPMEARRFSARDMYHPALGAGVGDGLVYNDAALEDASQLVLLGGRNRGGKTVYLRTAAALQVLFQMGLPLPAAQASMSPAAAICCVFQKLEGASFAHGKLGHELACLREAIELLDEHGIAFFNEPLSATSPTEGYLLSREALSAMKENRVRGIWVTHYYRLFTEIQYMEELLLGSHIAPMYTEGADYRIRRGMPEGMSGAREVYEEV